MYTDVYKWMTNKNLLYKKKKDPKLKKKSLQIINAKEGVEKRESSNTVGGNVNWWSHQGEHYGGSSKS